MDGRKYVPVQFSNSLGKLTSSSVYNPRQIIDLRQGTTQDDEGDSSELRQTLSKRLVVYKTIEKAYDIVMSIEDLRRQPKSIEKTNKCEADGECLMKIRSLVEVLSLDVEFNVHNDPVFPIMKIRKGKKLILRAMSFIAQEQRDKIVQSIFAHLSILIKRDARDGILHEMYPLLSRTLSEMGCGKFVVLLHSLSAFSLASAVKDQVGASLVCNLIARGSEIFDVATAENDNDSVQWSKFACDVCDVILAVANPKEGSRHVAPAVPVVLLERFPVDLVGALSEAARRESSVPQLTSSFQRLISVGAGDARD